MSSDVLHHISHVVRFDLHCQPWIFFFQWTIANNDFNLNKIARFAKATLQDKRVEDVVAVVRQFKQCMSLALNDLSQQRPASPLFAIPSANFCN